MREVGHSEAQNRRKPSPFQFGTRTRFVKVRANKKGGENRFVLTSRGGWGVA
jgi:hypothetical protein